MPVKKTLTMPVQCCKKGSHRGKKTGCQTR